jgi:anti-sigma regulatory factor (Ser/Thr protein kinase)
MNQTLSHSILSRQLKLAALPSAAPWARRMTRQLLEEWQLETLSDTALLVVSELVTNAVKASGNLDCPGLRPLSWQMLALTVQHTGAGVRLEVWDPNPVRPALQQPDPSSEGGRGLLIVECLADQWGHYTADGGKVVWCELAPPAEG